MTRLWIAMHHGVWGSDHFTCIDRARVFLDT